MFKQSKELKERAKINKENLSYAEKILWGRLNRKQLGVKFRKQHLRYGCIFDFYSVEIQFAIEIIELHDNENRDDTIDKANINFDTAEEKGFRYYRYTKDQVIYKMDMILMEISEYISGYHIRVQPTKLKFKRKPHEIYSNDNTFMTIKLSIDDTGPINVCKYSYIGYYYPIYIINHYFKIDISKSKRIRNFEDLRSGEYIPHMSTRVIMNHYLKDITYQPFKSHILETYHSELKSK